MSQRKIPPRLEVFLAPKVRKAVVLRRGPAKVVCTVGWDLSNDKFKLGQWLKGRIHGFCCDLSPDGTYFVYDVVKPYSSERQWTWTAVSRFPYLKAIGRWGIPTAATGGGFFVSENRCLLIQWDGIYQECKEITLEVDQPDDDFRLDCRSVYIRRQLRDGWRLHSKVDEVIRFEKPLGDNRVLRNIFDDTQRLGLQRGFCPSEYELRDSGSGEVQFCRDWEWADIDGGRLLWAEGGKIFSADVAPQGLGPATMLHDFNDMTFQEIEAPY